MITRQMGARLVRGNGDDRVRTLRVAANDGASAMRKFEAVVMRVRRAGHAVEYVGAPRVGRRSVVASVRMSRAGALALSAELLELYYPWL